MRKHILGAIMLCACSSGSLYAANLAISLGIRETGGTGPIFSDAGTTGGIEFVNLDGQMLALDGTWQQFTFTPASDTLTAFAGTTADSILDPGLEWAALEHIRIRNVEGITAPIRLWIDNITNTDASGPTVEGFEGQALGTEVMFQEPSFSGSTASNVAAGSTAAVTDSMAFEGSQSYETNFQFVDSTDTRWVRLTTFGTAILQDTALHVREPGAPNPTVSFYMKAAVIPEPATLSLVGLGLGLVALALVGRRRFAG